MNGRTRTPAGELARKGFIDASRAAELFNGLPECTDELVDALAAAADPDQALAGLVDLQAADLVGTLQALAEEPWRR
ncbi:hypothetical protein EFN19_09590, partial [Propionibacterium freudenreichii]|nr:hypothetical protein [Propionibacterium freudenreichii]